MRCEVALEAAECFAVGLPRRFCGDVGLSLGVAASAGDGDAMDRRVELAVAAAVEAVAVGLAGADRDRCESGGAGELASLAKRPAPAISPTSLAAVGGPNPGSESSCGAILATRSAISASSDLMVWVSLRSRRSSSRAIRTRVDCSARARRRPMRLLHFAENSALAGSVSSGQRSCRCHCSVLLSPMR